MAGLDGHSTFGAHARMNTPHQITIYGRADSSNVQAVMWGASELGLEVERLDYGHRFGKVNDPDYLAINPNGTVPTLKDGDLILWESCAILRYLAARYGDGGAFWPADPVARAKVDQWAEWAKLTAATQFTVPIFWAKVRTTATDRDEALFARNIADYEARLDILADQIGDAGFVVGEDFTLADVIAGHVLFRWFDMDILRKPRPKIEAYYQRLEQRPAFRKHVMVSYESLRVEGA